MRGIFGRAIVVCGLALGGAAVAMAQADADHGASAAHDDHAEAGHGHHELGHGNAGPKLGSPDDLRTDLAIYTFVVFMLLLGILSWFAWPKISQGLEEREKRIEANIAAAEAKHQEAKQLLAEHEAKLASAAGEVRALLEEARRDAESTRDEIVKEARTAAGLEKDRALRAIDTATNQAMKNIAETSANLAIELAGKAIRETINPAKQQEMVRSALAKLGASNVGNN